MGREERAAETLGAEGGDGVEGGFLEQETLEGLGLAAGDRALEAARVELQDRIDVAQRGRRGGERLERHPLAEGQEGADVREDVGALLAGDLQAEADVTVKPSKLARLIVQPEGPLTLKAGTSVSFILSGYDAFENVVAPNPTWSQSTKLGTISADNAFRAETVGSGELWVQQDDIRVIVPVSVTKSMSSKRSTTCSVSASASSTVVRRSSVS